MHNFSYVFKKEAAPYKEELIELIKAVQKEVKKYFTFRFDFVGSSSRNMITCERNANIGYDFDVNIEPNDPEEKYSPEELRTIIFDAFKKHMYRFGYSKIENSTSVITIKALDRKNKRIEHSCDFAIVRSCEDGRQQYIGFCKLCIHFYKGRPSIFYWENRGNGYDIDKKFQWIKDNGLKKELRDRYLHNKNHNNDPNKHSRTIFAESVNQIYNEYGYLRLPRSRYAIT
ncbi:MAG: hypothetical protein IJ906_00345 [Oscillospiraceae bacterium]|nr:hypothetical protein [Oscillospiraceae bacterium]